MTLKSDAKLEEEFRLGSKKDMTKLVNFNAISDKSDNLLFDILILSIAYKVWAKKVKKIYVSWHWRVIQALKKNSLFVRKVTWEIWWILTQAVENLKIWTCMGYFFQKYVMFGLKKCKRVVSWKMTSGFQNDIRNFVNFHSNWKQCYINPLHAMF